MKAKYTGKIKSVSKDGGETTLLLECVDKVDTRNLNAQTSSMEVAVKLKSLVADELKLGTNLTIHLSDEEVE